MSASLSLRDYRDHHESRGNTQDLQAPVRLSLPLNSKLELPIVCLQLCHDSCDYGAAGYTESRNSVFSLILEECHILLIK